MFYFKIEKSVDRRLIHTFKFNAWKVMNVLWPTQT